MAERNLRETMSAFFMLCWVQIPTWVSLYPCCCPTLDKNDMTPTEQLDGNLNTPLPKVIRFIKYRKLSSILMDGRETRPFKIYAFVYIYFIWENETGSKQIISVYNDRERKGGENKSSRCDEIICLLREILFTISLLEVSLFHTLCLSLSLSLFCTVEFAARRTVGIFLLYFFPF